MSALPLTDPCCLGTDVLTELLGGTLRAEAAVGETSAHGAGVHQRLWASSGQGGIPGLLLLFREQQGMSFLCSSEPSRTPGSGTFVHPASPVPAVPTAGLVGARMRRKPRASHGGRNVPHFRPGEVCTAGSAETRVPRAVALPSCSSPLPEDLSRNQQPRPPDLTPPGVLCSLKAREWSSVTDRPGAEPRRPGRRRGQLQTPA